MHEILIKHNSIKGAVFQEMITLLKNAPWSINLAQEAFARAKVDFGYYNLFFSNGLREMVQSFELWLDEQMVAKLCTEQYIVDKVRAKISLALITRIIEIAHKNVVLHSSSFLILPGNFLIGNKVAWNTCDSIWNYAKDQSTDFNYYTKRILLIKVYLAAKMFFLADNSINYEDTRSFIINSINQIVYFSSVAKNIKLPKIYNIPIIRLFL